MAVKLRLMRLGRKGQPFYRIVAVDSRKRRDGVYIEKIGHYNPLSRPADVVIDDQKALKWLGRGAIPSDTVRGLFSRYGVMMAFDLQKKGVKEEEIQEKVAQFRLEKGEKLKTKEEAAIAAFEKKIAPAPKPETAAEPPVEAQAEAAVETPAEKTTEAATDDVAAETPEDTTPKVAEPETPAAPVDTMGAVEKNEQTDKPEPEVSSEKDVKEENKGAEPKKK